MNPRCPHCDEQIIARSFPKCPGCRRDLPEEFRLTEREKQKEERKKQREENSAWISEIEAPDHGDTHGFFF